LTGIGSIHEVIYVLTDVAVAIEGRRKKEEGRRRKEERSN